MSFFTPRAIAASCAAAVSVPATIFLIVRAARRPRRYQGPSYADLPVDQWNMQQVVQWLRSLGVSETVLVSFLRNEVDGSVLLLLEEGHLMELAPKLRDFILIREGLGKLRDCAVQPRPVRECVVTAPAARNIEDTLPVGQRVNPPYNNVRFQALLQEMQGLAPGMQVQLVPTVVSVAAPLAKTQREDATTTVLAGPDVIEQLQTLHKTVDGFLHLLDSTEMRVMSDPRVAPLRANIEGQVRHVMAVSSRLPPPHGEPLRKKCELILQKIRQGVETTTATTTTAGMAQVARQQQQQQQGHQQRQQLQTPMGPMVQRLRDIFTALRSSDLVETEPGERLVRITGMLNEARIIQREAESSDDPRAVAIMNQVAGSVISVLQQMESLTREELEAVGGDAAGEPVEERVRGQHQLQQPQQEQRQQQVAQLNLSQIVSDLQSVAQMLHSDRLASAPPEVQLQIVSQLRQRLRQLQQQVARLPLNETTATVAAIIERTQGLIASLTGDEPDEPEEQEDCDGDDDDEKDEQPEHQAEEEMQGRERVPTATSTANPLEAVCQEDIQDKVVNEANEIFNYINSDRFKVLPAEEKSNAAQRLLSQLCMMENRCAQFGCLEQLQELLQPMKEILQMEIKPDSETPAPTPLFLSISAHLTRMSNLMNSDGFQRADIDSKRAEARSIIPQLQKIASALSQLPPHERSAVERLIAPINAALQSISARSEEAQGDVADPRQVVAQMETVLSVLQSEEFINAPQQQRQQLATELVEKLEGLKADCGRIGGAAAPLLPIIERIRGQLLALTQCGRNVEEENGPSEREGAPDSGNNDNEGKASGDATDEGPVSIEVQQNRNAMMEERQKLFKTVADITAELRTNNDVNARLTSAEAQPLVGLLEMIDSVGFVTPQEKNLRDEFEVQIRRAKGEDSAAVEESSPGMENLMRTFTLLKERIGSPSLSSPTDLLPIMAAVDQALSAADQNNVPWRNSPPAVSLISEVLTRIQEVQRELGERRPSELESILNEAATEIRQNPPQNEEQLQPYTEMLSQMDRRMNNLSVGTLQALKNLQEAVLVAAGTLHAQGPEGRSGALLGDGHVAQLLVEVSDRLREGPIREEVLDQYALLLDNIEATRTDPSVREAVDCVREQIHLQRIMNGEADDEESDTSEAELDEEENETEEANKNEDKEEGKAATEDPKDDVEFTEHKNRPEPSEDTATQEKEKAETMSGDLQQEAEGRSATPTSERTAVVGFLSKLPKNCVPGGAKNELLLLPRIEKKIFSAEQHFIANTTLFDIQNISKVILHLEKCPEVKSNTTLLERVSRVKRSFAQQLQAFHASDQQSTAIQTTLSLYCRDTTVAGECVRELVICTAAEAAEDVGARSSKDLKKCLAEGKAAPTTVGSEVVKEWCGRSIAVLVCEFGVVDGTALSELVLLHEVLGSRYGFDVVTVTATSASQLQSLLQEVAASGARRVLLYYYTDAHASPKPHSVLFRDGSSLTYRDALQQLQTVHRVVLAHCQPLSFSMVSEFAGHCSPFFLVRFTAAASEDVRAVRCWLYDGLFTPAVTELLCLDERRMLCPEDLATFAVTTMTSLNIDFGSFTEGEPSGMGFFVPCDASD